MRAKNRQKQAGYWKLIVSTERNLFCRVPKEMKRLAFGKNNKYYEEETKTNSKNSRDNNTGRAMKARKSRGCNFIRQTN